MPIYEYQCQECGHKFETLQKMSDDPLTECPKCHNPALKKLISAAAFHLKGSGWYETDFKNKNSGPNESAKDQPGEGGAKPSDEGKKGDQPGASASTGASSGSGQGGSGASDKAAGSQQGASKGSTSDQSSG